MKIKRFLAVLICFSLMGLLIPMNTFAYVGAMHDDDGNASAELQNINNAQISNDYLKASIKMENGAPYFKALPAAGAATGEWSYHRFYYSGNPDSRNPVYKKVTPNSGRLTTNDNKIVYTGKLLNGDFTLKITYELIKVENGSNNHKQTGTAFITADESDDGKTWALLADAEISTDSILDKHQAFTMDTVLNAFGSNGHSLRGNIKLGKFSETAGGYGDDYRKDTSSTITSELANLSTETYADNICNGISEVYTDSFSAANEFAALYGYFNAGILDAPHSGVEGHGNNHYGGGISIINKHNITSGIQNQLLGSNVSLIVKGFGDAFFEGAVEGGGEDIQYESQVCGVGKVLCGYRNLYPSNTDPGNIPADPSEIPADAGAVGIVYDNGRHALVSSESKATMEAQYGKKLIACFSGEVKQTANGLSFKGGAAQLAPSMKVTWSENGNNGLFLKQKGDKVEVTAKGVQLSSPSFTFFKPKDSDGLTFKFEKDKFWIDIASSKNKAVLHIDIPGAICELSKVTPQNSKLTFEGKMGINTSALEIADIEMQRMQMDFVDNTYSVSGIQASGQVSMDKLIGMDVANVAADINTFGENEYYKFSLEFDAEVISAEGELELTRISNGELLPNKLYFGIGAEPGIPLVPPTVVARLTGGGGGFDGLAQTVEGSYKGLPPLKLTVKARGKVLEIIDDATIYVTIGAGSIDLGMEDAKIVGMDILKNLRYYTGISYEDRTYGGKQYEGLALKSGGSIGLEIPRDDPWVEAGAAVNWTVFAGENGDNVYILIGADGQIYGAIKTPKSWGVVGGIKVASAQLDFVLGGQTVAKKGDFAEAVRNISGYGGVAYTGKFIVPYRIYYIFNKQKVGLDVKNAWEEFEPFNPYAYGIRNSQGEQIAVAKLESNAKVIKAETNTLTKRVSVVENTVPGVTLTQVQSADQKTYSMQVGSNANKEYLSIQIVPKDGVVDKEFLDGLIITENDTNGTGDGQVQQLELLPVINNSNADKTDGSDSFLYNEKGRTDISAESSAGLQTCGENTGVSLNTLVSSSNNILTEDDTERNADAATVLLSKTEDFDWSDVKITGIEDFDIGCIYSPPFAFLKEAAITGTDTKALNYTVDNIDNSKEYAIRVYLGKEKRANDYMLCQKELDFDSSGAATGSLELSLEGSGVPTGEYYVNAVFLEKVNTGTEGEAAGDATDASSWINVGSAAAADRVTYTNNEAPAPVGHVQIKAVGSELMRASWMARSTGCDGYYINIYQQDDNNEWINTGIGYEAGKNENELDMALTVGGEANDDGSGAPLEAGKKYRIGVIPFKYKMDSDEDGTNDKDPVRGAEALSDVSGTTLPEADYPVLSYSPQPTVIDSVKTLVVNGENIKATEANEDNTLAISADKNCSITVKRMDNGDIIAPEDSGDDNATIKLPADFVGSLMLEITVTYTNTDNNELKDTTVDYVKLEIDDEAPIITLDKATYTADKKIGTFTITGFTEANAAISVDAAVPEGTAGCSPEKSSIKAGMDGSFTFSGSLNAAQGEDSASDTAMLTFTAIDAAGNTDSENAIVVRSAPVPGEPQITTGSLKNGILKQAYTQVLSCTGDTPITWSIESGKLPKGLSLSESGIITGIPMKAGTSKFTVKAQNSIGSDTKTFTIKVSIFETIFKNVKTGDSIELGIWMMLMVLAAIEICIYIRKYRKKGKLK